MNRTIWIWRAIALLIIIIFTILMWSLYTRLQSLEQQRNAVPAVEQPSDGVD